MASLRLHGDNQYGECVDLVFMEPGSGDRSQAYVWACKPGEGMGHADTVVTLAPAAYNALRQWIRLENPMIATTPGVGRSWWARVVAAFKGEWNRGR